ncbi:phosphatase PAP2 family protein [Phyllobacterium leguminum]|uniref:PAP2 superfamily protein n=1 Tax=Phyllobacterium leguminum TaxID=314237 RepID=A0A318T987_9HYPH|nr:phosphatase PAP2 family protein [Phyllobacterium leguminum]PYE90038.1 PAP2 superfamily protein [Phyllobacterium leguminum]
MRETTFKLYDTRHDSIAPKGAVLFAGPLGLAVLAVSVVFIIFPGIDLAVTRLFADEDIFPLLENPVLKAVRDFNRAMPFFLLPLMIVAILAYALWPRRLSGIAAHKALYVMLSFAMGPGLFVQIGKTFIGRPRPTGIFEFGGAADFAPVWQFASICSRSCSFPSGEAALAAAAMSVLVFVPAAMRKSVGTVLALLFFFVAFNRVMFGAHFLSDVLVAWFGTLWVMAWLWNRIVSNADRIDDAVRRSGGPARRVIFGQARTDFD